MSLVLSKWYCKINELHIQRRDSEPKFRYKKHISSWLSHLLCDDTIQLQRLTADEWYRMIIMYEEMRNWEDSSHVAFASRDETMRPFNASEKKYLTKQPSVVCIMRSQTQLIYLRFSQQCYEEFCLLPCNAISSGQPKFQRNMSPPSSNHQEVDSKHSKLHVKIT
jgi:hypothetical protein